MKGLFCVKKDYVFLRIVFSLLLCFSFFLHSPVLTYADNYREYGGVFPSWIVTTENDLVGNMRKLGQSGLGAYMPPWSGGTTCVYSCSVSLRGAKAESPYGASPEHELDYSQRYSGDLTGVNQIMAVAKENGDYFSPDEYGNPVAGDVVIVENGSLSGKNDYWGDHAVMTTESGGFIYGGGTSSADAGYNHGAGTLIEINCPVMKHGEYNANQPEIYCVLKTSKYSNGAGLKGVSGTYSGPMHDAYQAGSAKSKAALLNNKVDWGLEHLATIGDGLNDMIEQFTILADNVLSEMKNIGVATIASLIIIDFTTFLLLNGFIFPISIFLAKLLKYCFLLFVFLNWDVIVNFIFLDFAQSTSAVLAGEGTSAHLTQPHFLLSKGVEAVSPALNFISNARGLTDISNWPMLAFLVIVTFGTMAFMIASAIYIAYIFIEFYLVAAFNAVFMIFPTLRFTKFIAENGLGSMVKSTIKLFVAACLVYIIAGYVKEANFAITWPSDVNSLADGTLRKYLFLCGNICFFVWMILRIPGRIADVYGGKIDLPG